jgi:hypothetical protein
MLVKHTSDRASFEAAFAFAVRNYRNTLGYLVQEQFGERSDRKRCDHRRLRCLQKSLYSNVKNTMSMNGCQGRSHQLSLFGFRFG